jgi:transposase-like protein
MREKQNLPNCPRCGSSLVVRNGHIHNGKAKFACKACQRQLVEHPRWKPLAEDTKGLIDKLLLERLSLAAICRISGVSKQWLQTYVNAKYAAVERTVQVPAQKNDS